jgi:hypothetical protein
MYLILNDARKIKLNIFDKIEIVFFRGFKVEIKCIIASTKGNYLLLLVLFKIKISISILYLPYCFKNRSAIIFIPSTRAQYPLFMIVSFFSIDFINFEAKGSEKYPSFIAELKIIMNITSTVQLRY